MTLVGCRYSCLLCWWSLSLDKKVGAAGVSVFCSSEVLSCTSLLSSSVACLVWCNRIITMSILMHDDGDVINL